MPAYDDNINRAIGQAEREAKLKREEAKAKEGRALTEKALEPQKKVPNNNRDIDEKKLKPQNKVPSNKDIKEKKLELQKKVPYNKNVNEKKRKGMEFEEKAKENKKPSISLDNLLANVLEHNSRLGLSRK